MPTIQQDLTAIRNAVYGKDVREAIADGIEHCYEESTANSQIAKIEAKGTEVLADLSGSTEMEGMIADPFSSNSAYVKDKHVIQNVTSGQNSVNKLFRFTADHAAGNWTGTDATEVKLADEVGELKSALDSKASTSDIEVLNSAITYLAYGNIMLYAVWSQGGYADLSEDPPTSINTGSTRIHTCVSVTAKEKVTMECLSGFRYCYSVYVDNIRKDYKSSWTNGSSTKEWAYGAGTYTIYISFAKSSNTSIAPNEAVDGLKMIADDGMNYIPDEIRATQAAIVETRDCINDAFPGNPMFTLQWLLGGYSNLSDDPPVDFNTGNTRARLKVVVDVKRKLTVSCASGYKYLYSIYKGNTRQTYGSVSWNTDAEKDFEYGEGTYTLYMSCANTSNTAITADEAKSAITILADNAVLNIYDAIGGLKETKNLYDPGANNTLRGYYNASNTWVTSHDFGQTDYIPVKQNVQYISASLSTPVLWFDANKDFLQSTASSGYTYWITPPTGAAYVKFLIQTSNHTSFYVYSDEPDSVQVPLDGIPYGLYNQYAGKKAVAFGTSLTYRAQSSGGYLEYLPEMAQMTVDNQGLGNSTILEHQEHTDMMGMITGYTGYADKNVVLLEGFVNDWYDNSDKLGTWKDEGVITSTTVCGRIRYAINYILTQNPHTTLIMILDPYGQAYNGSPGCASTVVKSGYTQMEYYDEIAKLAESLGIPTIKGYAISGMNELVPDYYIDIIHPSSLGAKQFANVIWENMKNIPIKMQSL